MCEYRRLTSWQFSVLCVRIQMYGFVSFQWDSNNVRKLRPLKRLGRLVMGRKESKRNRNTIKSERKTKKRILKKDHTMTTEVFWIYNNRYACNGILKTIFSRWNVPDKEEEDVDNKVDDGQLQEMDRRQFVHMQHSVYRQHKSK